jgi:aspartyl-tRNA(Asn)/glutamyl-tRNA(Gln) amidotransferase subunit A
MSPNDLSYLTIAELAPLLQGRKLSPVELMLACLERIHSLDDRLHTFITLTKESAMEEARAAEKAISSGDYRGPMHGIPIGLKDLYHTRGVATTAGSPILKEFVPEEDATSVAMLKKAGGIVLGKLNMFPFAYGATGLNPHYGTPGNPWDMERLPGGSSSGSGVALMAGMIPAATGSDTGGSIRIPASLCGVVGIKPTYGRVSRSGVIPLSWSLDHAGPMARSVEDCAILLQAMAGHDPKDDSSSTRPVPDYRAALGQGIRGLRVGVPRAQFFTGLQDGVRTAVEKALVVLEQLGLFIQEIDIPNLDEFGAVSLGILGPEAAAYHQQWLRERPDDYPLDVLNRLQASMSIPAVDYVMAQQSRTRLSERLVHIMEQVDLLVTPTEPMTAPRIGDTTVVIDGEERTTQGLLTLLTRPFNVTGMPAISVPCGFDEQELPVGLQIAGRPFDEATVLRAAHAYERATPWHTMRPGL